MPRAVAADLIDAVLNRSRLLDEALDQTPAFTKLAERDRALVSLLVRTFLRHLGEIDAVIDAFLDKPLGKRGRSAHNVIRIGITQLLFLDIPEHAAVDTAVSLCRGGALAPYRKLVNAILRRAQREGTALLATLDKARLNTPDWLWQSWTRAYGEETTRAIAAQHLLEPPLDLTLKTDPEHWAEKLDARLMPTGTVRFARHVSVTKLEGFADGAWWVQDLAASLPARLLGDVTGLNVIDLCCAPGGKTLELASFGAHVTAVDRSEKRLQRVASNLQRTRLNANVITANAETWRPPELADAVLLDAPCSATGTIRRHPDVPYLKTQNDVIKLANLQGRLLRAAVDMVRPGGAIVYCTCSLQPEEGPEQIAALLQTDAPVKLDPIQREDAGLPGTTITAQGFLRTLPCHLGDQGGMDGFFAARLRRL